MLQGSHKVSATQQEVTVGATLTDVARRAGVSLATASRAFNDPDRVATDTHERVLAAASELDFEAPLSHGSRTFAVVVPDVGNAVFAALIRSIQDQAWHGRHRMILANTAEDSAREQEILQTFGRSVDGVILCSPRVSSAVIKAALGTTPLVVINGETDFAPSVLMDVEEGIRQAVEHLFALGHRRIAFVPGPVSSWANQRRLQCVVARAAEWNMELTTVGNQAATVNGGLAAAAAVVSSGATGVIAYNDLVALGVQAGARTLGYHCPEDLSIVGIDDIDVGAASEPGLTSIRVAFTRSGSLSLELLLDRIAGKPIPDKAIHLTSQLIVRGSTFAARDHAHDESRRLTLSNNQAT
jgi:DNA-binding LacI/PurR family transcriptional regulator